MLAGAFLTAFGILALGFASGIHYTSHEKFPRDGKVQISVKEEKVLSIPPVVSGLAIASGVALMIAAARK
jgi:hypothetical protein